MECVIDKPNTQHFKANFNNAEVDCWQQVAIGVGFTFAVLVEVDPGGLGYFIVNEDIGVRQAVVRQLQTRAKPDFWVLDYV